MARKIDIKRNSLSPDLLAKKKVLREQLLDFYANAKDAKALSRSMSWLSTNVLGASYRNKCSNFFTRKELAEIQTEALQLRREMFAPQLAQIDEALLKSALKGSEKAIRLAYERFEGWSAKNITPFSEKLGVTIVIERTDGDSVSTKQDKSGVNVTITRDKEKPALKSANKPAKSLPEKPKQTQDPEINTSNNNKNVISINSKRAEKAKGKTPVKSKPKLNKVQAPF